MQIIIVTQYFWPENFRLNELIEHLQTENQLTIITSTPNYPNSAIFKNYKKKLKSPFKKNKCKIIRIPTFPRHNNIVSRLLNYISFSLLSCAYVIFLRKNKYEIIFTYQLSPIYSCLAALLLKKRFKIPLIMWTLDLWPDTLFDLKIITSKILNNILTNQCKKIYSSCDLILSQSKSFISILNKYTDYKTKIIYFPSWSEEVNLNKKQLININIPDDYLKIVFTGNLGDAQNLEEVIEVANKLKNLKIKWIIVGDGKKYNWLKSQIENYNLTDKFLLFGSQPKSSMPKFFNLADVFLVSLKQGKAFSKTIPAKIQSYLYVGKPILGHVSGESKEILINSKASLVSNPSDLINFEKNILRIYNADKSLINQMSSNAKKYYEKNFNQKKLFKSFTNLINTLDL